MAYSLPNLPYPKDALSPILSQQTMEFHYGKHHKAYVDNLNKLVEGRPEASLSLEDLIRQTAGDEEKTGIFNNAAQAWNHSFYWNSMRPGGGGEPTGDIASAIARDFGGAEGFREAFSKAGATQFGSGWAWLVVDDGALQVRKTPNAATPIADPGVTPLLTMDVWEHAYYLDYQNRRPDYISAFLDNLVNWEFANENLAAV